MSEKKAKAAPKAAPKVAAKQAPKVPGPDRVRWGSARVHTATVDGPTAARMQACGYRVESNDGRMFVMFGDADALKAWQAAKA
jgi:hypothetical protein